MFSSENIIVKNNVTLITLRDVPSDPCVVSSIFESVAENGINVDMISRTAPHGSCTEISFTVDDKDFARVLTIANGFQKLYQGISSLVSSENVKITVSDESMRTESGIACAIFKAAAKADAEIKIVTTSETEVSLLIDQYNEDSLIRQILSGVK